MLADPERPVVADASPLIGLAVAGVFDVLRSLLGTVTISRTVLEEIRAGGALPGTAELEAALREGWIRVAPAPPGTWSYPELGAGEASTIALALEQRARAGGRPLVLMDDAQGGATAAALGLEVLDVSALLVAARRAGLIGPLRPLLARLARRGFTIPEAAVREALLAAGEAEDRSAP